jgi:hypothetical protein
MVSINLFQPGKFNVTIELPSAWEELHTEEIIQLCKQQIATEECQAMAKAELLLYIIRHRAEQQKQTLPSHWQQNINISDFSEQAPSLLQFLFADNQLTKQPQATLTLPGIFSPKVVGPKDAFADITCGEFEDAEIHFSEFIADPGPLPLANLMAILWRKPNQPYVTNSNGSEKRYQYEKMVPQFLKLQPWQLYAAFMWYFGCRARLPLLFPTIHEGGKTSNEPDILAFTKCIHAGAGPKNGTRLQIRQLKVLEFFFDMEQEAIHAKEMEAQYEQHSN